MDGIIFCIVFTLAPIGIAVGVGALVMMSSAEKRNKRRLYNKRYIR